MLELEYLLIFMFFFAVWAICFLICGQSWQLIAAFIPFSIGTYIYYGGNMGVDLLLLIPVLALPTVDIHIVLSRPKFKGATWYINYLLIIPLLAAYIYYSGEFAKSDTWIGTAFTHLSMCLIIVYAGKFWFSDVLLLLVNRLWIKERNPLQTRINNVYIKGTGKSRSYYASIYQLGDTEISGFFYQYVRFKKIGSQDKVELVLKKGWLGTEFISGFPKILERKL
ncbi:hypothetical protein D3C87_280800 [compost metagenome]